MDGWQCCAHELRTIDSVFNQTAPLAATPAGPFSLYRARGLRRLRERAASPAPGGERTKGPTTVNLDYSKLDGLIPAVAQDATTREVLMVGFMNAEAFERTRLTGYATFFSRSRGALWTKGETSGNRLVVTRMLADCDEDTVVLLVNRQGDGKVCHTGERSCFFRDIPLDARPPATGGGA